MALVLAALVLAALVVAAACSRPDPPRRYVFSGQVLAVHPELRQLTVKHGDIVGYMPGMTMSFEVADPKLLEGRVPGDLVTSTLEVTSTTGRLVAVERTGSAPLPENTNEVALLSGLLDVGDAAPDAAFIDQQDRRRSLAEWRGFLTLVTFIYTRCPLPTFCPLMDQNFAAIQRSVAEDPVLRGRVRLISISFDPDYDTPAVLAEHGRRLRADTSVWTFLTGDRVTIDRTAAKFGVSIMRGGQTAAEVTHNLRTIFIGADGRIAKIYPGSEWTTASVLADLRRAQ